MFLSGSGPPELHPDEDYARDPLASFGILEAKRHRSRGVTLGMFIGLMKYYRQAYLDILRTLPLDPDGISASTEHINRFFDRLEIGFCMEWNTVKDEGALRMLQEGNRAMTNEKNRYLTIFESLFTPVLIMDESSRVINFNYAASFLFDTSYTGTHYYAIDNATKKLPPWLDVRYRQFLSQKTSLEMLRATATVRGVERVYEVTFSRKLDVSGKYTGIIIMLHDVTQQTAAEEDLRISETKYRELFENMLEGAAYHKIIYDENGEPIDYEYYDVNDAFVSLTGIPREDVINHRVSELFPELIDESSESSRYYRDVAAYGIDSRFEQYLPTLKKWFSTYIYSPHKGFFVSIFHDITHSKRAMETIMAQRAELSSFAHDISHEIKGPLQIIRGYADLLRQDLGPNPMLEKIIAKSDSVTTYISDALKLADAGAIVGELGLCDPNPLLDELASDMIPASITFSRTEIPSLYTNPSVLHHIFQNLFSNAVVHGRPGTVSLCHEIVPHGIVVHVTDNGIGISPEVGPSMFNRGVSSSTSGTGLGLSIVKRIVDAFDGDISVSSPVEGGTTFSVLFPFSQH
jgi:nitrogen-specific signal transduction histidine kinase